jgi:hypothetical protein
MPAYEASSIGFGRIVRYGLGVLEAALEFRAARLGLLRPRRLVAKAGPLHSRSAADRG